MDAEISVSKIYQANCRASPKVYQQTQIDPTVLSIGFAIGSGLNDESSVHALRRGTSPDMPIFQQHIYFLTGIILTLLRILVQTFLLDL